ncbi:hypothetical protein RJ640_027685, partial [Escallonia rubra]
MADVLSYVLNLPGGTIDKCSPRTHDTHDESRKGVSSIPVDILDNPKEYVFFLDVPGLSKSDIQVTVEEENTLLIKSNGKRKQEDGEEEGY